MEGVNANKPADSAWQENTNRSLLSPNAPSTSVNTTSPHNCKSAQLQPRTTASPHNKSAQLQTRTTASPHNYKHKVGFRSPVCGKTASRGSASIGVKLKLSSSSVVVSLDHGLMSCGVTR